MNRTSPLLLLSILAACGGDAGFSHTTTSNAGSEESGVLEITATALDFTDVDWEGGISSSQTIKVSNASKDNVLKIYEWGLTDSAGGVFYTEDLSGLELTPEGERELVVVATLTTFEAATGAARLRTNDPDAGTVMVSLTAEPVGWTGDPVDTGAPEDTGAR